MAAKTPPTKTVARAQILAGSVGFEPTTGGDISRLFPPFFSYDLIRELSVQDRDMI